MIKSDSVVDGYEYHSRHGQDNEKTAAAIAKSRCPCDEAPGIILDSLCGRSAPVIRMASKLFLSAGAQFGFPFLWPFQIRQKAGEQANRWEERTDSVDERDVGHVCQLA